MVKEFECIGVLKYFSVHSFFTGFRDDSETDARMNNNKKLTLYDADNWKSQGHILVNNSVVEFLPHRSKPVCASARQPRD